MASLVAATLRHGEKKGRDHDLGSVLVAAPVRHEDA